MTRVAAFVRGWFAEPPPTAEIRTPGARWGTTRTRRAARPLRIAAVVDETPTVRSFVLAAPDGGPPSFDYRAGQHLTLLVEIDGRVHRRCYSFSSSPLAGGLPVITVRLAPDGLVSRHLHRRIGVGDTLQALDPSGEFTLAIAPDAGRHVVLVAGGVGITPLVSLAETVLRAGPECRVTLLCGNRSEEEIVFRRRLADLEAAFTPRLEVRHALDQPPDGWTGLRGALDGDCVLRALEGCGADAYFVCGPQPMMDSVCAALAARGVPRECVHTERFAYASAAATPIPQHSAGITFARSGRRVTARPGQSVLQAGLEAGVDLPSSCTMGGCGACKVRRSRGTVVMSEPNCLSDAEREAGYLLACCAYADSDLVIEGH
jgi:ring-1,2-phenylacetyl-CoA epoxidase subunit PaaE